MIYLGILSEIYSEPFGHPLTVFALRPILDVWKSREYISTYGAGNKTRAVIWLSINKSTTKPTKNSSKVLICKLWKLILL